MNKQNQAFVFPVARRTLESGYTVHGCWFPDPYQWLEQLENPEVLEWIAAQEGVTQQVLQAVQTHPRLREMLVQSSRYARLSKPIQTGRNGQEFLWQANAEDDKLVYAATHRQRAP